MIEEVPPGPKDKGDIRGIKGVIGPTAWSPWWWLVMGLLLAGAGYLLWRKRKQVLEGPPPPPPVPPDVVALEKLQALKQTDWLVSGKTKEFYSAISDIVRAYLEGQFRVPALERTTSELMRDLRKKSDIPAELQAELRELLDSSDLVKFAKFRPDAAEGAQALQEAVKFVEQTRGVIPAEAGIHKVFVDPGVRRGDERKS
jgi:LPXTG-motif cell wall-anchored protein